MDIVQDFVLVLLFLLDCLPDRSHRLLSFRSEKCFMSLRQLLFLTIFSSMKFVDGYLTCSVYQLVDVKQSPTVEKHSDVFLGNLTRLLSYTPPEL